MAIAKIEQLPKYDMGSKLVPWQKRHAAGKDLRRTVPRESHAEWIPSNGRPDPLKLIAENNYMVAAQHQSSLARKRA